MAHAHSIVAAPRSRPWNLRLSMAAVWQLAAIVASVIVAAGVAAFTADTWWALKMGELSVEAGRPVLATVLAHTPVVEHPTNGQWLGQVLLYGSYAAFGEVGIRVLAALLIGGSFWLLLVTAREAGGSPRLAAIAVLAGVLLASSNVAPRAQLFAFPLFVLTLFVLRRRDRSPGLLWSLPLTFGFWANVHGSFILGPVMLGLHAVGDGIEALAQPVDGRTRIRAVTRLVRRYLPLVLVAGLAPILNPLGAQVYGYIFGLVSHPMMTSVEEWRPPSIHEPTGLALAVVGAIFLAVALASRRRLRPSEALVLLALGYLALSSQRNVVWLGLALVPIMARLATDGPLTDWGKRWQPSGAAQPSIANTVFAGLLVAVAVFAPVWRPMLAERAAVQPEEAEIAPRRAVSFLATLPPGQRLYHYQPWMGYLAWTVWPNQLPFLDARVEAHPPAVWDDYLALSSVRADWQAILDRYDVTCLLLQKTSQQRLATTAEASGQWQRVYEDDVAVILVRAPR